MEKNVNIHELIENLMDQETPFPPAKLCFFSDLDRDDCRTLQAAWKNLPLKRRHTLLEDLADLAERDFLMMFEEVGKIALQDEDPEVLVSAIDLLFQAEDDRLVPAFLSLLKAPSQPDRVRAAAANALGQYVYLGELEAMKADTLREVEEALLKAYKQDPSDLVRRRVLESLGYSSREEVPALLRAAAQSPDDNWVESAMFAMGKSADDQWQVEVLDHLDDDNQQVRIQAIHAAGELSLDHARQRLVRILNQEKHFSEVRHEAIWALSQIGGDEMEAFFERLLDSAEEDEEIQWLEDALDALSFTNASSDFDLLTVELDGIISATDEGGENRSLIDHLDINDAETLDHEEQGYDREEWNRYVSDDDYDDVEAFEDEEFEDFDNEDDLEEDYDY